MAQEISEGERSSDVNEKLEKLFIKIAKDAIVKAGKVKCTPRERLAGLELMASKFSEHVMEVEEEVEG